MYELSNMQISTTFVHVKNWRKRSFFLLVILSKGFIISLTKGKHNTKSEGFVIIIFYIQ